MAAHIEQLVCTEKELLANVSHELRTPLARIRVALDLAASDGAKLNYLPEIAEDLGELERMIDDILTTTRLDLAQQRMGRSTTPLRFEPTDLRQVLARAISRFSDHHPDRELLVEVPEQLPTLPADPVMLRRVLDNLLDNADKYSNSDRAIELRAAVLPTPADAKRVQIILADHGIGIDQIDLQHVFTPFFRSDRSRARQTGGVGLGLPLALRIVRAHGGTIDLASEVGTGTTVTVTLPLSSNA
jgi:signal transduction histidine kinase